MSVAGRGANGAFGGGVLDGGPMADENVYTAAAVKVRARRNAVELTADKA